MHRVLYITNSLRKLMIIELRVSCLGKCVGLGFGLGWEKEKSLRLKSKSKNFQWLKLFPYYSFLWVPHIQPKCFNLHNTHQKSNCQTLLLYSEKKNNRQTITGHKYRLTPDLDMWSPQGSLCVEALSASRKYYSRSRKYYYQLISCRYVIISRTLNLVKWLYSLMNVRF